MVVGTRGSEDEESRSDSGCIAKVTLSHLITDWIYNQKVGNQ